MTLGWIVGARFADRVGKGIRGAPRDALITDITPADVRGRSFGLRQALDTVGAIGGPLMALGAMAYFAGNFHAAFWVAVVPAALCVLLIVVGVDEPDRPISPDSKKVGLRMADIRRLPRNFVFVVTIARRADSRAVLRSVSGAPRAKRRISGRAGTAGDGGDVDCLRRDVVSGWCCRRSWPRCAPAVVRIGGTNLGRSRSGECGRPPDGAGGCCVVGPAHGSHARAPRGTCRGFCASGYARNGLRRFQSCLRYCAAHRQRTCRVALGCIWTAIYFLCGCDVHTHRVGWISSLRSQRGRIASA